MKFKWIFIYLFFHKNIEKEQLLFSKRLNTFLNYRHLRIGKPLAMMGISQSQYVILPPLKLKHMFMVTMAMMNLFNVEQSDREYDKSSRKTGCIDSIVDTPLRYRVDKIFT